MSDDLDLRGIDQRHEPDPEFRAALRRRVLDIAAGIDPSESTDPLDFATLDIEPVSRHARPTRRRPLIRAVLAVAAAAAVVAAIVVVISRDNETNPADTPSTVVTNPLEEPSPDEAERASDAATYLKGSGHTAVTPARNYVSLRCQPDRQDIGTCPGRRSGPMWRVARTVPRCITACWEWPTISPCQHSTTDCSWRLRHRRPRRIRKRHQGMVDRLGDRPAR